jgi:hypothetical protein
MTIENQFYSILSQYNDQLVEVFKKSEYISLHENDTNPAEFWFYRLDQMLRYANYIPIRYNNISVVSDENKTIILSKTTEVIKTILKGECVNIACSLEFYDLAEVLENILRCYQESLEKTEFLRIHNGCLEKK